MRSPPSACSSTSSWAIARSARRCSGPGRRVTREGLVAGLAGAVAVAVWFLLYDLAAGAPLRTPALLGATLFHGLRDPSALVVTSPLVLQYTAVHGLAFVLFGWAAAGLLALADREPRVLFGVFMLFCCFEVFFIAVVAILAERLFDTIAWWTILAGNLLASLVMLGYFFRGPSGGLAGVPRGAPLTRRHRLTAGLGREFPRVDAQNGCPAEPTLHRIRPSRLDSSGTEGLGRTANNPRKGASGESIRPEGPGRRGHGRQRGHRARNGAGDGRGRRRHRGGGAQSREERARRHGAARSRRRGGRHRRGRHRRGVGERAGPRMRSIGGDDSTCSSTMPASTSGSRRRT